MRNFQAPVCQRLVYQAPNPIYDMKTKEKTSVLKQGAGLINLIGRFWDFSSNKNSKEKIITRNVCIRLLFLAEKMTAFSHVYALTKFIICISVKIMSHFGFL
ncbi:hypothetical protein RCL_jg329.t2 [Rhizophagus clarus]|uniref:Uncharacterized protein n=1 Tax=Rhizophagus clarus TaxID=94130 RepID=A0A8H3LW00_9GLOM|nr:hypothetical protein RCL_jg329.t2 [Rhizophagus clarus]